MDFEKLSLNERTDLIDKHGVYVAKRFYYNQKVLLYSVGRIFIEVFYHPELNEILNIEIISFESMEKHYLSGNEEK